MTTYIKLVKGATKIKMAPPKAKYVDPILMGTADPADFREIVRALDSRIHDTAWTIVYKALIVVHLIIREGDKDVGLDYYCEHLSFFQLNEITKSAKWSSGDIRALERYNNYLKVRCKEYGRISKDYVRDGYHSLKSISGNGNGIAMSLEHVESLEVQISALIKNRYSQFDLNNELLLCGFKLLVQDLLSLYNALNEGIITLLESFFELSHKDAERTLELYKQFVDLTEHVVKYLKAGKSVGLKIPVIKHITTKLIRSLEEHLREDEKNHETFATIPEESKTPTSTPSLAQQKLEQIRKQKTLLQQQLQNQQLLVSPSVPQQPYNPFGAQPQESFSFEQQPQAQAQQIPQATGNPFLLQGQGQGQGQAQQPLQQTGFYSANTQLTPSYTGAGFGGYSNNGIQISQLAPAATGPNNPFAVAQQPQPQQQETGNPFTQQQLGQLQMQQNPFQQQSQLHEQPQIQAQQQITGVQTMPNLSTYDNTGQQAGYNPFQLQQQQQQQQQQQHQQQLQQQQLQQQQLQQQQLQQQQMQQQQLQQQQLQQQQLQQQQLQQQQLQQQQYPQQYQQQTGFSPNPNLIDI